MEMKQFVPTILAAITLLGMGLVNANTAEAQGNGSGGGGLSLTRETHGLLCGGGDGARGHSIPLLIADQEHGGYSGGGLVSPELPSVARGHFQGNGRLGGTNTGSFA